MAKKVPDALEWTWKSGDLERRLLYAEIEALRQYVGVRNTPAGEKCLGRADAFAEVRKLILAGP